jgi:hypothetical protein
MTEKFQDQMPGLTSENEVLVRGHVRRVKPAGERKPRAKPYPSKWGRGKCYTFSEGRTWLTFGDLPWRTRISFIIAAIRGGQVGVRMDGHFGVLAAKGSTVKVSSVASIVNDSDALLGPRDERP